MQELSEMLYAHLKKKKKKPARSQMQIKKMIHFIRAIKTLAPVFIHHTHEMKIYGRKSDIYLEIKFKIEGR